MWKRERSLGALVGRIFLLIVGVGSGLFALDALVVLVFLALGALFGHRLNPYIGLLMFVALPAAVAAGATIAYSAYLVLKSGASQPDEVKV